MTEPYQIASHVKVMHRLENKGFEAFLVGGCVRDRILHRQSKDFDVTTDATPDQVRAIFTHTIPVGAKFGVVVVVMDGVQVEVATYRADGAYTDGRRPDEVTYSRSAKEDVVRRDFTMNGLLLNSNGDITDHVGGQADIERKVIRAIGDANVRFAEDALRMMRALRFAAQLGFDIEKNTLEAITANARLLSVISRERIAMELFKLLSAPEPLKGIIPFITTGLYRFALPKVFENYANMLYVIQRFGTFTANKDAILGMAMLFADTGEFAHKELADYLKFSNDQKVEILSCGYHVSRFRSHLSGGYAMPEAAIKRQLREPGLALALEIMTQDEVMGKTSFGFEALMAFVLKIKAYKPEEITPTPLVTGKDLIAAGIPAGPIFTSILFDLESFQLSGVFTTKEQGLEFVRERVYTDEDKHWVYAGLTPREVRELE
jgi:poly(A) polymerase